MSDSRPSLTSIVHVALTVTDLPRSVAWYERVMGLEQVVTVPHQGGEGVVMADAARRVWWALHRHDGQTSKRFSELQTGLDHVAFLVDGAEALEQWVRWLDACAVEHEGIQPLPDFGMAVVVLRDPDGVPIELLADVEAPEEAR